MPLIVVTGATGTQGGSVARIFAKDSAWKVRGLTRNPNSDKAKELERLGIEIVFADLNNSSTLSEAFSGATAVFGTTNFWEIAPEHGLEAAEKDEEQQFINIADACTQCSTLKHLILSTMPNCRDISNGKLPCPHWDAKARGGEYVKKAHPGLAAKTTYVWLGWYLDNMVNQPLMFPQPYLGQYILAQPSKADGIVPVAGVVSLNTGIVVHAIISQPEKTHTKYVPIVTDFIPWIAVVEGWSKTTGKPAVYAELTDTEISKLVGPVSGPEMASQFRFSEQYPDWYSYYPQETISIGNLGIEAKVYNFARGLEHLKDEIKATLVSKA
ncbi:NmrA-like family protein [Colletotrichum lupini]|nr:NmrA-like family protein [Colletotrichum lupini]